MFLYSQILKLGFWNPDKDEHASEALLEEEALSPTERSKRWHRRRRAAASRRSSSSLLPVLVPLVLIAFGAIADAAGFSNVVIAFLGNPVFALFVGLVGAYVLARRRIGRERTDDAMSKGFDTTGQILLITGVGGSLGAVIAETDLKDVLGDLFSADAGAPLI